VRGVGQGRGRWVSLAGLGVDGHCNYDSEWTALGFGEANG